MPDFSVVIPAFNEEKTVEAAVLETRRIFGGLGKIFEVIVVDDGSSDRTADIVDGLSLEQGGHVGPPLRLIRHATNQGKGAAVKTGVLAAQGEWIVFLDCDLATHPSEIEKALPLLGSCDVVIGSRRVAGADIAERQPVHRHWLGRIFNLGIRIYLKLPFHDTQCGFKLFHRRTVPLFEDLESLGWAFDVELLYRALHSSYRIKEIPVTWRNGPESRVKLGHSVAILREIRRIKRV
ncbi:MAG: dolichyl-phosphate beta-glucosyltransferase [Patescibacteria group bacterium]